jgi:hypothetical protein
VGDDGSRDEVSDEGGEERGKRKEDWRRRMYGEGI